MSPAMSIATEKSTVTLTEQVHIVQQFTGCNLAFLIKLGGLNG